MRRVADYVLTPYGNPIHALLFSHGQTMRTADPRKRRFDVSMRGSVAVGESSDWRF